MEFWTFRVLSWILVVLPERAARDLCSLVGWVAGVVHAGEVKLLLAEHVLHGRFRLFVHARICGTPLLKIEKGFE